VLVWGFLQRRAAVRWLLRGGALVAAAAGLILFVLLAGAYMERFGRYFRWEEIRDKPVPEMAREVLKDLPYTSRGLIIWGALRAWQSEPVWGVGPGMHQNVWPHFCATPDGDRELGIWPSRPHHGDHAYAAHCDWVQLLEEYGAVGLALLLAPALCLLLALDAAVRRAARRWRERAAAGPADGLPHAAALGALLAFLAMAFHSLGDYNLQMPATVWVLAAGIALALRQAGDRAAEGGGAEARR
jgi:O-antigen ligase